MTFHRIPSSSVTFRINGISENDTDDFKSTFTISNYQLFPSKKYRVNNPLFTVLNQNLNSRNDSGWAIRNRCRHTSGQSLATKAQYQQLWQHLHDNRLLNTLDKKIFATL